MELIRLRDEIKASEARLRDELKAVEARQTKRTDELRADIKELRTDNKALGEKIDRLVEILGLTYLFQLRFIDWPLSEFSFQPWCV